MTAMGGTCCFDINPAVVEKAKQYELEVLTVMVQCEGRAPPGSKNSQCEFNGEKIKGAAGHVVIRFPNGEGKLPGIMLVSAGHWIELVKLDTSVEMVKAAMEEQMGAAAAQKFYDDYQASASNPMYQEQYLQQNASMMVWQQAPVCYGNISKKSDFSKK